MNRVVEPEILDTLAPEDPAARHARRDLRLFNLAMSNRRWLRRTLCSIVQPGERILEIGAGTGELGRSLHALFPAYAGLDRIARPAAWPTSADWHQTDVLQFDGWDACDVVVANLVLHHFDHEQLQILGQRLAPRVRVLVACEPARHRRFEWLFSALCMAIRAHAVSRRDGRISIRAGFRGDELPSALGLAAFNWNWRVHSTELGAYRLVARNSS